jgi:MFS superfamily sulfate permease-like transporter
MRLGGNAYDLREAAGALGDLGTLVPFLMGYLAIARMDPVGVLVAFGMFKILAGLTFRTPVPIQPMKAIGTVAISHPDVATPGAVLASGLFTGALWLGMGTSGAVTWIARLTGRPVVRGIVLGLGLAFMLEGLRMAEGDRLLAVVAAALTFALLCRGRVPAVLVLLALGVAVAVVRDPVVVNALGQVSPHFRLPRFALGELRWADVVTGVVVLGIPQAALTLGNAIVATVDENNALFPHRPLTVRTLAVDHGIMNLVASSIGGVPMCHGAGGMAAHVRFGARTGGALVMLGLVVLVLGLFFADSVTTLLRLFPPAILGVVLFFGGLELAAGAFAESMSRDDRHVLVVTAALSMWNMGVGYAAGLLLFHAVQRGWIRI